MYRRVVNLLVYLMPCLSANWSSVYPIYLFECLFDSLACLLGRGPRVVVSTVAFHTRARGSFPGLGGLKETKMFLPHPLVKLNIVGSLRDREVACSALDRQGSNFKFRCLEGRVISLISSSSGCSPGPV